MSCQRICIQQRQPCPSAWLCEEGCHFTNATLESTPLQTANSDSSNSEYPLAWLDTLLNAWDDMSWWQRVLFVCAVIVVCGMVAGVLTGYGK